MPRSLRFCCLVLLALTLALTQRALRALPAERHDLVAEKYAGWSGVLRLWVAEDALPLAAWLHARAAAFEKAHPGVYVRIEAVARAALGELAAAASAPDLLLFPPGALETGGSLLPLSIEDVPLRAPLSEVGLWLGEVRAVPVAMGAYAWAYDRAALPALPASWAEAGIPVEIPEDEPVRCWSGAVLALCSGLRAAPDEDAVAPPGLDLGLAPLRTAAPTPISPEETGVPCALPPDATRSADIYGKFLSGKLPALPVAVPELQRLERLDADGKAPDWDVALPGCYALADQLALVAAVDRPRPHAEERAALARAFIAHLLSPESQAALPFFPVTAGVQVHSGADVWARLEAALAEKELLAPPAFSNAWRAELAAAFDRFRRGECTAREALHPVFTP